MTENSLNQYFNQLDASDRDQLQERKARYQSQLESQGYEVAIAEGDGGLFAGVLVIDDEEGRFGFLEADGSVSWIGGGLGGIGALGSAIAQNPTEKLEADVEGLDDVDVE